MNHDLSCLTQLFSWMLLRVPKSLNQDKNWLFVLQLQFYKSTVMKACRCRPHCSRTNLLKSSSPFLSFNRGLHTSIVWNTKAIPQYCCMMKKILTKQGVGLVLKKQFGGYFVAILLIQQQIKQYSLPAHHFCP